jgi:hypothetical protein
MIRPIAGNMFKQVMAKLGHQLWRIDMTRFVSNADFRHRPQGNTNTMMIGVDVSHDKKAKTAFGGGSKAHQSTVGFVASYNASCTAFNSFVAYQSKGDEFVQSSHQVRIVCVCGLICPRS